MIEKQSESDKAKAFRLAGKAWGKKGRALVGKAVMEGVDYRDLLDAVEQVVESGGDYDEFAYVLMHDYVFRY